ncbi:hypothetical protein SMD44_06329 [Streptomyces alboflavus]|uniref:Uncharacterized protein n=1 Tax=Streptomyces alboflavus TaxID=67267 RepID=A0A1Z1WKL8_9ACTN|nr:hypothetical protein SMD44_06329 [Streptomyces alboflavus]
MGSLRHLGGLGCVRHVGCLRLRLRLGLRLRLSLGVWLGLCLRLGCLGLCGLRLLRCGRRELLAQRVRELALLEGGWSWGWLWACGCAGCW